MEPRPTSTGTYARACTKAGLYTLDSARLESLELDLIVTQELCAVCAVNYETVARAANRLVGDPRIVSLEPCSLADVYATIALLGDIIGNAANATSLIDALRPRAGRLHAETAAAQTAGERRPRALVLEWTDSPMGGGHWNAGTRRRRQRRGTPRQPGLNSTVIAWEDIAAADPDVVIVAPCGFDLKAVRRAVAELEGNAVWRNLRAQREHEVYLNRPGPRLLDTAEIFATIFYEDAIDVAVLDPHAWQALHD
ncbi:MAG: ABC transporter substrate-binding protein [Candidatus Eremiobacteraeota bacterium]|nr:ABC transporter substrate-binding protein [Candidatus Eremiobacteraeota bacterium]